MIDASIWNCSGPKELLGNDKCSPVENWTGFTYGWIFLLGFVSIVRFAAAAVLISFGAVHASLHGLKQWYFVTKIVLTYCEKKMF